MIPRAMFGLLDECEVSQARFPGNSIGIYTTPRFVANDAVGNEIAGHSSGDGITLGHEGARGQIITFAP